MTAAATKLSISSMVFKNPLVAVIELSRNFGKEIALTASLDHAHEEAEVLVGEGTRHVSDTLIVFEETGLADVLFKDRILFIDMKHDNLFSVNIQTALIL